MPSNIDLKVHSLAFTMVSTCLEIFLFVVNANRSPIAMKDDYFLKLDTFSIG
jgi:hypothetical protein